MCWGKSFVFVVGLGLSSICAYGQPPEPSATATPNAETTPFIVDPTQAEPPEPNAAPTPTPDMRFPANPIAPKLVTPEAVEEPEKPAVPRAEPVSEREVITRLQIFLDQRSFGPGKIDGRWGEFCAKALQRYQIASGQPPTGQIDEALQAKLIRIFPIYTTYTLTEEDFQRVGEVPSKPKDQAKTKALLYRSITEFIAERFHADDTFIEKLNADRNMATLKPGDTVRVPNVPPFRIEDFKEIGHLPVKPEFVKQRSVRVDTRYRMLDIIEGDKIISSYPITPGSKKLPAPPGTWKVVGIATLPWFRWDEAMLNHGERSDNFYNLPPGPRNPVGIAWIGLSKRGVGIHGTNSPDTIGRSGSHGCIRLANWDAARVVNQVTDGMTVEIF